MQSGRQPSLFGLPVFTSLQGIAFEVYESNEAHVRVPDSWMRFILSSVAAGPSLSSMVLNQLSFPDVMLMLEASNDNPRLKTFQTHCLPDSQAGILELSRSITRHTMLTKLEVDTQLNGLKELTLVRDLDSVLGSVTEALWPAEEPVRWLELPELCQLCIEAPPSYIVLPPLSASVVYLELKGAVGSDENAAEEYESDWPHVDFARERIPDCSQQSPIMGMDAFL
ncbi:hypothetical protein RSAG8_09737, partial [Rhizoctonia solani AG-8 WAC10335]